MKINAINMLRQSAGGLVEPSIDAAGNSNYSPVRTGLHLCGVTPDGEQPYSAANIPATSFWKANEMFKAARLVGECAEDEADFCVDLMLAGDCEKDFWTNRQLWPLIVAEVARLTDRDRVAPVGEG